MNSIFHLAARRTKLGVQPPEPGAAPVSEKRVGLNRCHVRFQGFGTPDSARFFPSVTDAGGGMHGGGRILSDG